MPVLVHATINHATDFVQLKSPYNADLVSFYKSLPGPRWSKEDRAWYCSRELFEGVISPHLGRAQKISRINVKPHVSSFVQPPGGRKLRPFQDEGARALCEHATFVLIWDMRVGKTPTAVTAATHLLIQNQADVVLVCYPGTVQGEWQRQWPQWSHYPMQTLYALSQPQRVSRSTQVLGIHYEILADWVGKPTETTDAEGRIIKIPDSGPLSSVLAGRRFCVIYDEVQCLKNRKGERYNAALELSKQAKFRWGLTGTPMRNRNRDLYGVFQVMLPGSAGAGYSKFGIRYCDYHEDEWGHWQDKGSTNSEELAARLKAFSSRKTRNQVAGQLPKAQRNIVWCDLAKKDQAAYKRALKACAPQIARAIEDPDAVGPGGRAVLEKLAALTTTAKLPRLVDRIQHYFEGGFRTVVFSHLHETTDKIGALLAGVNEAASPKAATAPVAPGASNERSFDAPQDALIPFWQVDGRQGMAERRAIIEQWRATPKGVLLAGTLAAGIGIDLSQAEAALFTEYEWVPADFRQAEDRLVDVHQGSRKSPPIYEYLTARGTIDEAIIRTILSKLRDIEKVVGGTADDHGLRDALGKARPDLETPLDTNDMSAVRAALLAARDSMLKKGKTDAHEEGSEKAALVAQALATDWDDDQEGDLEDDAVFS